MDQTVRLSGRRSNKRQRLTSNALKIRQQPVSCTGVMRSLNQTLLSNATQTGSSVIITAA
jgi:hypothetical protein